MINNNKRHINQLVRLIKSNNIKIYFNKSILSDDSKSIMQCHSMVKYNIKIYIGTKNSTNEDILATIAHEFGHCISYVRHMYNWFAGIKNSDNCYMTICRGKVKKNLDLKEEMDAWDLGFEVLRQIDIPITKTMKQIRNDSIASYC